MSETMATTKPVYTTLGCEDDSSVENDDPQDRYLRSGFPSRSTIVLSITTIIFGLRLLYLSVLARNLCLQKDTISSETGYSTEWAPAKSSIELSKVRFKSALRYNETSKLYYREYDPTEPQYVGPPSPAIDQAWEELLGGQYIVLTEAEGLQLDEPVPIKGYYLAEVEVMHSLHCLNALRKSLNQEYYMVHEWQNMPAQLKIVHEDHCLEQLRQTIQCAGDLTPVPLRPYGEGENLSYIGNPQVHTCRNWNSFRRWYSERGDNYGKIDGART